MHAVLLCMQMMSVLEELGCESLISAGVKGGHTHQQIALELQQLFPGYCGLSARSVRRFCFNRNIHRSSQLDAGEIDAIVEQAVFQVSLIATVWLAFHRCPLTDFSDTTLPVPLVALLVQAPESLLDLPKETRYSFINSVPYVQVGPSYGRRTINGLLRANDIIVGEQRVRQSLNAVAPIYVNQRRIDSYHQLNPTPYYAEYFGHKFHADQNEKMVKYGVTHVAASDGYSGKLLKIISMPIKNNLTIYQDLYRYVQDVEGALELVLFPVPPSACNWPNCLENARYSSLAEGRAEAGFEITCGHWCISLKWPRAC